MKYQNVYSNCRFIGGVGIIDVYGNENTIAKVARICRGVNPERAEDFTDESNRKLVSNLLNLKHYRPFEFCAALVYFEAPIYVERQLRTYRKPDIERSLRSCAPYVLKSGNGMIDTFNASAIKTYNQLIEAGEKREEARRVLPLDTITAWYSLINIRQLLHIFEERLAPAAQSETRAFCQTLKNLVSADFPTIFKELEK